jgi:hypothetical protein
MAFSNLSFPGEVNKCNDAVNGLPLCTNCVLLTGVICTNMHVDSAIWLESETKYWK